MGNDSGPVTAQVLASTLYYRIFFICSIELKLISISPRVVEKSVDTKAYLELANVVVTMNYSLLCSKFSSIQSKIF